MYGHETAIEMQTAAAELSDSEQQLFRPAIVRYTSRSRASRGNEWSSGDLRTLRELAAVGTPPEVIATTLRRTASAVRNKAGMHGISLRPRR